MQFKVIIATLAFALSATASPTPNGGPTGQDAQNDCSANQVAACCDSVAGLLGVGCVVVELAELLSSQCSGKQVVTCCNDPGAVQGGLIDVNIQCSPITAL